MILTHKDKNPSLIGGSHPDNGLYGAGKAKAAEKLIAAIQSQDVQEVVRCLEMFVSLVEASESD